MTVRRCNNNVVNNHLLPGKMDRRMVLQLIIVIVIINCVAEESIALVSKEEKGRLRDKVKEMFDHAYRSYMENAYPADELMPLSCKGRFRGSEPSRGDIDDALGNFSLTLIDTMDTLVVLGEIEEFEKAVKLVIRDVTFDTDVVVSVFETNIRVLGGLLGGHFLASYLKKKKKAMHWYNDELVAMARDLGDRLLPAFNTTTGVPFPRVNLKFGVNKETSGTGHEKDTCTACAGTMILEFAALSRLTGEPVYEEKARKVLEVLWKQRHRSSHLVGTVINIHNGDWVRRESGVGAGIDSYYEYLLKAYILLGDETYLDRFNKHYESIMRYMSQGPMLVDVHMHKPLTNSRHFMDSLHAFWPGLQILKGDIKSAIEIHEMLYQVTQRHHFLPEAFTTDFRIHWGQHPLRPEFVESTYFIYKATGDPYYLEVGKTVLNNLESHARVPCGFASIKDVSTMHHEDQMDSFVLAETFKYLYLLFSEAEDLMIKVDDYIFTTEGHLIPLAISLNGNHSNNVSKKLKILTDGKIYKTLKEENVGRFQKASYVLPDDDDDTNYDRTCPNTHYLFPSNSNYAHSVRSPLKDMVKNLCPKPKSTEGQRPRRLRAEEFISGNTEHLEDLRRMGIRIATMNDGRVQLLHSASEAASAEDAEDGMVFMQEMIALSKRQNQNVAHDARVVQLTSYPFFGQVVLHGGPAQFGYDLKKKSSIRGDVVVADPYRGCGNLKNADELMDKIVVMERGDCMFIDKARNIQAAGAIGGIVIDNTPGSSESSSAFFAMSGDGTDDVQIPVLFLFHVEGKRLHNALAEHSRVEVMLAAKSLSSDEIVRQMMKERNKEKKSESPTRIVSKEDEVNVEFGHTRIRFQTTDDDDSNDDKPQVEITDGPDNTKQLNFQLEQFISGEGNTRLSDLHEELMKLLEQQTNFPSLDRKDIYTKALNKLVRSTFSRDQELPDKVTQSILDELTRMLHLSGKPDQASSENSHYASPEELLDAASSIPDIETLEPSDTPNQDDVIIDQQSGTRYTAKGPKPKCSSKSSKSDQKLDYDSNLASLWAHRENVHATITVRSSSKTSDDEDSTGSSDIQQMGDSKSHTEIKFTKDSRPVDDQGSENDRLDDDREYTAEGDLHDTNSDYQGERTSDQENDEKSKHFDDEL